MQTTNVKFQQNLYKFTIPSDIKGERVLDVLRNGNMWESKMMKMMQDILRKDDIAIDVGAYVGTHSVIMSSCCKQVHSIEPQPFIYKCLIQNVNRKNVKTYNRCAYNTDGEEKIFMATNNGRASLQDYRPRLQKATKVTTKTITIDSLNLSPRLIKIDTEGSELAVLEGAEKTVRKHRPYIIIESWKKNYEKINSWRKRFGYEEPISLKCDNYLLKPRTFVIIDDDEDTDDEVEGEMILVNPQ